MVPPEGSPNMEPGPGEVLEPDFDDGKPEKPDQWRTKLKTEQARMLKYLETGERYWYAEEGYGSERRKTKA